jgi:hypothetical protein
VGTSIYPYTSWRIPWIHSAFENAAATISGIESAYKALKKKGKLPGGDKEMKFVAFGGDGGTYDIGIQALSGSSVPAPLHSVLPRPHLPQGNYVLANSNVERILHESWWPIMCPMLHRPHLITGKTYQGSPRRHSQL